MRIWQALAAKTGQGRGMPAEIYVSLVDALYKDFRSLFVGSIAAGGTALITALTSGSDINLVLTQGVQGTGTGGYVLTVPTAIISKVKPGQDSKGGPVIEFEFESNGSFTLA